MKKNVLALLRAAAVSGAAAIVSATALAQTTAGSWVLTPSYASEYIFRGARLGGEAFQPSLEYDRGALAVGVWSSFPISRKVPGQSDPEFDFYGAYTVNVSNDTVSIVPGFTLYTFPHADKTAGFYKATFEPSVALNYLVPRVNVRLTPKLYYDVMLDGATAELTAAFALPLTALGSELDFSATCGSFLWHSAAERTTPDVKNWGDYGSIGVSVPYQISQSTKVALGLACVKGWNNNLKQGSAPKTANPATAERVVFTVSLSSTF